VNVFELGSNDHGGIAEFIAGTTNRLPPTIEQTIHTHAVNSYSSYISDAEALKIRSVASQQGEVLLTRLNGITLPEDGDWGPSNGWVPGDVLAAIWLHDIIDPNDFISEGSDPHESAELPIHSVRGASRSTEHHRYAQIYYPIEVKSFTSNRRIRLTQNQSKAFELLGNSVDYVHPILVIVDLNNLPESVGIDVELVENSRWAEGARTKSV
jgi:hypothetical protein